MSDTPLDRLQRLGLALTEVPAPSANYVPYVVDGRTVYLAGQINEIGGKATISGKIPSDHSIEAGQKAAEVAALNLLASLRLACGGDLGRVDRCLTVRGFVNADPDFPNVPLVINGASNLFVALFGEAGKHARTAIGVATLPKNGVVEVDAIFRLKV